MENITINPLAASHRQAALAMIATAFSEDDPLAQSQGIGYNEFYHFIDSLYDQFMQSNVSYIAIDKRTKKVVAIALSKGHQEDNGENSAENSAENSHQEGSDAIADIISKAHAIYFANNRLPFNALLHIHFIASHAHYRRQKLVKQLVDQVLNSAQQQGYQKAIVEASGIRSRTLLRKHLQFTERVAIDYAHFQHQGRFPFKSISTHGALTMMDRML